MNIRGPVAATQVGTCNNCTRQISKTGTISDAVVWEITFKQMSMRLCRQCLDTLVVIGMRAQREPKYTIFDDLQTSHN